MRILCNACGAKYQVDDEKVKNRSFKFPCKKCGNRIVVRQEPERPAEGSSESLESTKQLNYEQYLEKRTDDEGAVWYVALGNERVGPIDSAAIKAYVEQERVTPSTYVWSEGMDDWAAIMNVPALSHLLPEETLSESPDHGINAEMTSAYAPPESDHQVEQPGGEGGASEGEADVFMPEHTDVPAGNDGSSPVVSTSQLTGQRHENSVLFSLDNLDKSENAADDGVMKPSAAGNTEGSGLIDLASLGGGTDNLDKIFGSGAPNAMPMGAPIKPNVSLVNQSGSSKILLIGGSIAAAVVVSIGTFFALQKFTNAGPPPQTAAPKQIASGAQPPTAPAAKPAPKVPVKKTPKSAETTVEKSGELPAPEKKEAAAGKVAATPVEKKTTRRSKSQSATRKAKPKKSSWRQAKKNTKRTQAAPAPRVSKPKPAPRKRKKAGSEAEALLASLNGGGSGRPKSKRQNRPLPSMGAPAADPTLPKTLERGDVLKAVRRSLPKIKDCRRLDPDISGKVTVRFVINGTGRVSSANAKGNYANTDIGNCVVQKVRAIRFPPFSGKPITIRSFPFSL